MILKNNAVIATSDGKSNLDGDIESATFGSCGFGICDLLADRVNEQKRRGFKGNNASSNPSIRATRKSIVAHRQYNETNGEAERGIVAEDVREKKQKGGGRYRLLRELFTRKSECDDLLRELIVCLNKRLNKMDEFISRNWKV